MWKYGKPGSPSYPKVKRLEETMARTKRKA
jgi:hypothetical protein